MGNPATRPEGRVFGLFPLSRHGGLGQTQYEVESRSHLAGRWSVFVSRLAVVTDAAEVPGDVERVPTDRGEGARDADELPVGAPERAARQ